MYSIFLPIKKKKIRKGKRNVDKPEHDSRGKRETNEAPEIVKGFEGKSGPSLPTGPTHYINELCNVDEPPRRVQHHGGADETPPELQNEQPAEQSVQHQRRRRDPRHHHDPALRLQELLRRVVHRVREQLRDHPQRELPRRRRNRLRLPYSSKHMPREDVEERQQDRGGVHNHPRALHVHSQHVHLPRSVSLST